MDEIGVNAYSTKMIRVAGIPHRWVKKMCDIEFLLHQPELLLFEPSAALGGARHTRSAAEQMRPRCEANHDS